MAPQEKAVRWENCAPKFLASFQPLFLEPRDSSSNIEISDCVLFPSQSCAPISLKRFWCWAKFVSASKFARNKRGCVCVVLCGAWEQRLALSITRNRNRHQEQNETNSYFTNTMLLHFLQLWISFSAKKAATKITSHKFGDIERIHAVQIERQTGSVCCPWGNALCWAVQEHEHENYCPHTNKSCIFCSCESDELSIQIAWV